MPMTPDEVVSNLETLMPNVLCECPQCEDSKRTKETLQSAITLIQDYQKLRERVSVEKIADILFDDLPKSWFVDLDFENNEDRKINTIKRMKEHLATTAQSIVTYLQQPTEH